jgi:hypothetical protein
MNVDFFMANIEVATKDKAVLDLWLERVECRREAF